MFWIGSVLLVHTFAGYPAIIHFYGLMKQRRRSGAAKEKARTTDPMVSVVLVIRNEAERIRNRIENLQESDYPAENLEIIVVSDGSTDDAAALLSGTTVRFLHHACHRGKPSCINDGVAAAKGGIIVFADARQTFNPDTIARLVEAFDDPSVGAVSGELFIAGSGNGVASGVDAYWRLEKLIRLGESRIDSSIGCTGAVYAIRREAFEPLPPDTILDDVVCPMKVAMKGYRVLFEPRATAYDPQNLDPSRESRRKRRTLAGNFQMLFRYPSWLLPWRNRLAFQLISHKYLRLLAPALMLLAFASAVILASRGSTFFTVAAAGQIAFYLLAATGLAFPRLKLRPLTLPAAFVFLNFMTIFGLIEYLTRRRRVGW